MWADGHISKPKTYISVSCKDKVITEFLQKTCKGSLFFRNRIQKETGTIKDCYEWKLDSMLVVQDFIDSNFRNNINKIPEITLPSFLLGFLDGDGCIYHRRNNFQLTFVSKKDDNWDWFIDACNKLKLPKFKINNRSSWCKSLNKRTNSSMARITSAKALTFLDFIYKEHKGFCLDRKKQKYLSYKKYKYELSNPRH